MTFTPPTVAISQFPPNKSHLEGNSPSCSLSTRSSKIISSPGTKSLLAYVISSDCPFCCPPSCSTSCPSASVLSSTSVAVLSFLSFPFPVTASSALSKVLSTALSIFFSTLRSVARLALSPAFLRSFFPHWACTSVVPIRNNKADRINTSFFIFL